MAIANLRVPISALPKHDSSSFFDSLSKSLGGVVDEFGQRKSYNALADRIAAPTSISPVTSPAPASSTASAYGVAPVTPVSRGPIPDAYYGSIRSAESGGNDLAKNPNSSATGRYQFTEGTWNGLIKQYPELGLTSDGRLDPNQQEKAIRVFTQDNARALSGNGIPVNPANLYAAHFLGAGGANSVLSQPDEAPISNFVSADVVQANPFLNGMTVGKFKEWAASKAGNGTGGYSAPTSVDAVNTMAEGGVSLPNEYAGGGGRPSNIPGFVSNAILSDAPATNSNVNNILAQGATPVQRGGVDPETIQFMLRDPNLREMGLKLWAANAGQQKSSEPWQFVTLPDGTLARANQQTGAIERVGQFAKPQEQPTSFREYQLAKENGFQGSYADWEKVKTPGTTVTVNNQDTGEFAKKAAARNVDRFGNLADAGTQSSSVSQAMPVLRELLTQAPQGPVSGRLAEMFPGFSTAGDAFMAQINQIAPTLRVPGSGAMSDKDMDILMSSLPRLRSDPAANQLILNVFEKKAQLNAERGAIASQALRGEITPEEADKRIAEIDKTPLLDQRSRSMLQSNKGGTARPQTQEEFDALKPGDLYIDPDDGQTYRKP